MTSGVETGLQLYTVRTHMAADLPGTLARVAAIGYQQVEFAGYFGHAPDEIAGYLSDLGLQAPSAHVSPDDLLEQPERTLDIAASIGHHYVVLPWWEVPLRTAEGYRHLKDLLNRVGKLAGSRGLKIAYHNHDFEFADGPGGTVYDYLLQETDPDNVYLELDLYWAVCCSRDPLELLRQHPGRFPLLHAKDIDSSGKETDAGLGIIDFQSIFDAAETSGVHHIFVERDDAEHPMESAARGQQYLTSMLENRAAQA